MFGYTLIRKDRLEKLEKANLDIRWFHQHQHWMSGWKDLKIIFDYFFNNKKPMYQIEAMRSEYAKARGTDEYGNPLNTESADHWKAMYRRKSEQVQRFSEKLKEIPWTEDEAVGLIAQITSDPTTAYALLAMVRMFEKRIKGKEL